MTAPMSQHPDGSEPARGRRDPLPEHPDDRPEGLSDPRLPAHDLPQRESLDAIIAARLTRVELEPDRRARILAVLNSPQPRSADVSPAKAVAADRPRRTTWRRIPALAASAAVVIAIVALVWATIPSKWDRLEPQLLAQLAQQKWQPSNRWQTLPFESESAPPVSRFLRASPLRWQSFATEFDPSARVFELRNQGRNSRLFVLNAGHHATRLPHRPPQQPQTGRNGQLVAAWQEGPLVYVLMVSGPPRHYWDVVRMPSASLASSPDDDPSG